MKIEDLANLTVKSIEGGKEIQEVIFSTPNHYKCINAYADNKQSANELAIFIPKVLKAAAILFIDKEKIAKQSERQDPVNQMMEGIIRNRLYDNEQ